MSEDQKNPPAQPEFGELAPEGWSWNPEANAPHTPETLKAAEAAAKAAAKAKAAASAAKTRAAVPSGSEADADVEPAPSTKRTKTVKPAKVAKPAASIFVAPNTADSSHPVLSEDERKNLVVARAKLSSDRFITWGFLALAVFSVMSDLGTYVNLGRSLNQAFDLFNADIPGLNLEPYANLGLANMIGWGIVFGQAIVLGLTIWWAIRRMRAGRMAFWVPIVGFGVAGAVLFVGLGLAFLADPSALDAVSTVDPRTLLGF
jgi:hypothetical protein